MHVDLLAYRYRESDLLQIALLLAAMVSSSC